MTKTTPPDDGDQDPIEHPTSLLGGPITLEEERLLTPDSYDEEFRRKLAELTLGGRVNVKLDDSVMAALECCFSGANGLEARQQFGRLAIRAAAKCDHEWFDNLAKAMKAASSSFHQQKKFAAIHALFQYKHLAETLNRPPTSGELRARVQMFLDDVFLGKKKTLGNQTWKDIKRELGMSLAPGKPWYLSREG